MLNSFPSLLQSQSSNTLLHQSWLPFSMLHQHTMKPSSMMKVQGWTVQKRLSGKNYTISPLLMLKSDPSLFQSPSPNTLLHKPGLPSKYSANSPWIYPWWWQFRIGLSQKGLQERIVLLVHYLYWNLIHLYFSPRHSTHRSTSLVSTPGLQQHTMKTSSMMMVGLSRKGWQEIIIVIVSYFAEMCSIFISVPII